MTSSHDTDTLIGVCVLAGLGMLFTFIAHVFFERPSDTDETKEDLEC